MSLRVTSSTPSDSISRPSQVDISASGSASVKLLNQRLPGSVGGDQIVAQVAVVPALGHGRQTLADRLPALALILTEEDITVRGAGEELKATGEDVHRHTLDVAPQVDGKAFRQILPCTTGIACPGDGRVGVL